MHRGRPTGATGTAPPRTRGHFTPERAWEGAARHLFRTHSHIVNISPLSMARNMAFASALKSARNNQRFSRTTRTQQRIRQEMGPPSPTSRTATSHTHYTHRLTQSPPGRITPYYSHTTAMEPDSPPLISSNGGCEQCLERDLENNFLMFVHRQHTCIFA